jgi:hypothetical protein
MKAGFHTTDITPAIGMEVPGGYLKAFVQAIHDPLKARAAVLDDGSTTLAFVGLDTCLFQSTSIRDRIRAEVEQRCGIPGPHVMLAASHTHSGGPAFGRFPEELAGAPDEVKQLVFEHSVAVDPRYCDWMIRQTVTAVCEAHRKRESVLLSIGSGREEQAAFNRRFRMKNGRVYTHPGKGNPEIIEPAGPIDPEVGVVAAWGERGELLGCLVNYSCHATTFGGAVSADYICYLEQTIQGVMGRDAVVVFLQGASGDVTQVDNQSLREREFGERWSRHVGTRVGAEAVKVLATAPPGDVAPLAAATRVLPIPRRHPRPERLASSRRLVAEGLKSGDRSTAWTFAKEVVILEYLIETEPVVDVEVQALQVGPAVFLGNPAEYFSESGLAIKAASPFPHTYVVTFANGCVGYVPPEHAFAPTGGGYETVLTSYSNLEIGAAERIAEASIELARGFSPGVVPQGPQVEAPGEPWSYGVLGPDRE